MTEQRATYHAILKPVRPETLLEYDDPNFVPPNDADVRALKELVGATGGELARIVGVDARTWRAWSAPQTAERRQRIPYAAWRLLLLHFRVVEPDEKCPDGRPHQFQQTYPMIGVSDRLDDAETAAKFSGYRYECQLCGRKKVQM